MRLKLYHQVFALIDASTSHSHDLYTKMYLSQLSSLHFQVTQCTVQGSHEEAWYSGRPSLRVTPRSRPFQKRLQIRPHLVMSTTCAVPPLLRTCTAQRTAKDDRRQYQRAGAFQNLQGSCMEMQNSWEEKHLRVRPLPHDLLLKVGESLLDLSIVGPCLPRTPVRHTRLETTALHSKASTAR